MTEARLSSAETADAQLGLARTTALVLAGNQPFYPLYLWWLLGDAAWPLAWTAAALPGFLLAWWLPPRHGFAARVLVSANGCAHTLFCVWLLGSATGVQLFLLPCLMLAALVFRAEERFWMLALMAPPLAGLILIEPGLGAASGLLPAEVGAGLFRLNLISAGTLTAFLGLLSVRHQAR